mgnify:CR=1 FL=1
MPTLGTSEAYLYMNKTQGKDFKNAFKKGKWNDVDFLTSNFTGYQLALAVKSRKRPEKIKSIYLGYKHKDRITELFYNNSVNNTILTRSGGNFCVT